jgi:hypothetical protein
MRKLNRTVAVGVAGLALVGGAGAAIAASQDDEERQAFLNDAAGRLGVQPQALENALEEAALARVDAALAAGRITQAQADSMKARIRSGEGPLIGGFVHHGPGHHGIGLRAVFDAAAAYLGITEAELHQAKHDGKSLATIAGETGKSVAGLKQAMLAAAAKELDDAVSAGDLTAAQRREILADLEAGIDEIVQGTGFGRRGFRQGPGTGFLLPPAVDSQTA